MIYLFMLIVTATAFVLIGSLISFIDLLLAPWLYSKGLEPFKDEQIKDSVKTDEIVQEKQEETKKETVVEIEKQEEKEQPKEEVKVLSQEEALPKVKKYKTLNPKFRSLKLKKQDVKQAEEKEEIFVELDRTK